MSTNQATPAAPLPVAQIDWVDVIGFTFVAGAFSLLGQLLRADFDRQRDEAAARRAEAARDANGTPKHPHPFQTADDDPGEIDDDEDSDDAADHDAAEAAALLRVSLDASEDEIRAALRARLSSSRLHPDQGGDGEEAKRLIAAKNLLAERARRKVQP
jgi:hypothetical protein